MDMDVQTEVAMYCMTSTSTTTCNGFLVLVFATHQTKAVMFMVHQ